MKRKVCCFLLIVIFQTISFHSLAFSPECNVSLMAELASEGYIDVFVSLDSNPGIASFQLMLNFNNSKVEPVSVTKGAILVSKGDFITNLQSGMDFSTITSVTAYFVSVSDINTTGTLFTVRFKIKDNASGRAVFYLDSAGQIINQNEVPVSFLQTAAKCSINANPYEIMISDMRLAFYDGNWSGSVEATIFAQALNNPDAACVLAMYSSEAELVYLKFVPTVTLSGMETTVPFADVCIHGYADQPLTIKVLLLDDLRTMVTLAEYDVRTIR